MNERIKIGYKGIVFILISAQSAFGDYSDKPIKFFPAGAANAMGNNAGSFNECRDFVRESGIVPFVSADDHYSPRELMPPSLEVCTVSDYGGFPFGFRLPLILNLLTSEAPPIREPARDKPTGEHKELFSAQTAIMCLAWILSLKLCYDLGKHSAFLPNAEDRPAGPLS